MPRRSLSWTKFSMRQVERSAFVSTYLIRALCCQRALSARFTSCARADYDVEATARSFWPVGLVPLTVSVSKSAVSRSKVRVLAVMNVRHPLEAPGQFSAYGLLANKRVFHGRARRRILRLVGTLFRRPGDADKKGHL
jgi:hypothetical protein